MRCQIYGFDADGRMTHAGVHDMAITDSYVWGATDGGLYKFEKSAQWWMMP